MGIIKSPNLVYRYIKEKWRLFDMKQVYPVIFTQLNDEKDTVLIEVPDLEIITEGFGIEVEV